MSRHRQGNPGLKPQITPYLSGFLARGTDCTQAQALLTLGKTPPLLIPEEGMMMPLWHREAKQVLQQPVNMSGLNQVLTTCYQCHPLGGIIHTHGEVITVCNILARKHHISKFLHADRLNTNAKVMPLQVTRFFKGPGTIKPQGMQFTIGQPFHPHILWQAPAYTGIWDVAMTVRRAAGSGNLPHDILPGAEAWIKQTLSVKLIKKTRVIILPA